MGAIKELSWQPVRRGPYYCSPACGGQCKTVDYDRAGFRAAEAVRRLGPNWTARVHENLGWFAAVIDSTGCWYITLNNYDDNLYTAYLGNPFSYAGKWTGTANTPEKAIEKAREAAQTDLRNLQQLLTAAQIDSRDLYVGKKPR